MSRLRSFFVREATECLDAISAAVRQEPVETESLYRAARRLRGSAQMARFGGVADRAGRLERRAKSELEPSHSESEAETESEATLAVEAHGAVEDLERDVEAIRVGDIEQDPKEEAAMESQGMDESASDVPIASLDTLEYRGERALERALDLREALEDAIVSDQPAGPILDELFDLIRLGRA